MKSVIINEDTDGLQFMGRVNASISHELKNILAIISETTGFLGDLTELAASKGEQITPQDLLNNLNSIGEEIERGFGTIRQMNKFAHLMDNPVATVDVIDALQLAINLTGYLSYAGEARLLPSKTEHPASVETCPYRLIAVFYLLLAHLFKAGGSGLKIDVTIGGSAETFWTISFDTGKAAGEAAFEDPQFDRMATSIGVEINRSGRVGQLELVVPAIFAGRTR